MLQFRSRLRAVARTLVARSSRLRAVHPVGSHLACAVCALAGVSAGVTPRTTEKVLKLASFLLRTREEFSSLFFVGFWSLCCVWCVSLCLCLCLRRSRLSAVARALVARAFRLRAVHHVGSDLACVVSALGGSLLGSPLGRPKKCSNGLVSP